MTPVDPPLPPPPPTGSKLQGDAVSQMCQLICAQIGLKDLRWAGKGDLDIKMLATMLYNVRVAKDEVWKSLTEFMAIPEVKNLYETCEPVKATISVLILRAQANLTLGSKQA